MISIPIGLGGILPMTQLHGGHYEKLGNTGFHCVISTKDSYEGTIFFPTIAYLNKRYDTQNTSEILMNWEAEVQTTTPDKQMQTAVDKTKSRIGKLYCTKFIEKYNYLTFHGYVASYE